ncbi:MAG: hypothetical protein QOE01_585 [Actinomycetota bacterium]|nr:hypothetical protein [Actinomycetota bacterium]
MLRDAGVRTKLLAVLAIPTLLLVVVTSVLVGGQVSSARKAGQVKGLTDVAVQVNRVVHTLQEERSSSLSYLRDPSVGSLRRVKAERGYVDVQLRDLGTTLAGTSVGSLPRDVRRVVERLTAAHAELAAARHTIQARAWSPSDADSFYSRVIATDLALPAAVAELADQSLAQQLRGYGSLSQTIEAVAAERDLVEQAYLDGYLTTPAYAHISALAAQQDRSLADFRALAPRSASQALTKRLRGPAEARVNALEAGVAKLLRPHDPDFGSAVEWVSVANSRLTTMQSAELGLVTDVSNQAAATQSNERRKALITSGGAAFGLGLALFLAVVLSRRISRPLRRLTAAAGEIGDQLPLMVERMQTPGEGPGVEIESIRVESSDEIGQLATAFNTVNEVTIRVAGEQAALRASIAEMFVNVARRNQVLLGRQLQQLDTMEAREEDPDVLDSLFKLDHLATRMRRNAESLLVLAGIDSTRRLRRAQPISDVIRMAVGEIESFDRIDLSMTEDPEVSGRVALATAHLLAELLENAAHFSNPDTRVVVAAAVHETGVDLTITDYGLGMSAVEIETANERIANPPVTEIAAAQRLGHYVVGRLAARLGATVVLRRGRMAGTVVSVGLPAALFEGMSVTDSTPEQVPVAADDPAEEVAGAPVPDVSEDAPVGDAAVEDAYVEAAGDQPVLDEAVDDAVVDEPLADDAVVDPVEDTADVTEPRRGARRWFSRRRTVPTVVFEPSDADHAEPVVADPVAEPVAVDDGESLDRDGAAADEPVAAPIHAEHDAPVEQVETGETDETGETGEPAEPVAPQVAETAPAPAYVFAAAVDILPGRALNTPPPRTAAAPAPPTVAPLPAAPSPVPVAGPVAPAAAPVAASAAPAAQPPAPLPPSPNVSPAPLAAAQLEPDRVPLQPGPGARLTEDARTAQLQSDALSELRGIYEPVFVPVAEAAAERPSGGLTRRSPKAPDELAAEPEATPVPVRRRSASEVRGMLAGFRAGVERGRSTDTDEHDTTS